MPLVAVNPLGSLIYQTPYDSHRLIAFTGDTDDFTINVDAGQTLTILVQPGFSLQASIEVRDPSNAVVGSATGASAGSAGDPPDRAAADRPAPTRSPSAAAGSLGTYSLGLTLNAALEEEAHGGTSNNDRASAQDLGSSFITLAPGADRARCWDAAAMTTSTRSTSTRAIPSAWGSSAWASRNRSSAARASSTPARITTRNVASGDVNGDGNADLADHQLLLTLTVSVMLGNGDGTFSSPSVFYAGTIRRPWPLAMSPAMGRPTSSSRTTMTAYWVFPGDGLGGFGSPYSIGYGGTDIPYVTLAMSTATPRWTSSPPTTAATTCRCFLNDGSGSFAQTDYSAGTGPQSVSVADVNGDTYLDLVVGNDYDSTSRRVESSVLLGDGAGGFGAPATYSTGGPLLRCGGRRLQRRRIPDIVATSYSYWNGRGAPEQRRRDLRRSDRLRGQFHPTSVAARTSMPTARPTSSPPTNVRHRVGAAEQRRRHVRLPSRTTDAGYYHNGDEALVLGDFNGDGLPDIATAELLRLLRERVAQPDRAS